MLDNEPSQVSPAFTDDLAHAEPRARPRALDAEQRQRVKAMVEKLAPKARRIAGRWGNLSAEELLQIAGLVICEHALDHDPARSCFFTYVFRRAVGAMVDACRRAQRERLNDAPDEDGGDECYLSARTEDRRLVETLLSVLDPEERALVTMTHVEGRSLAEAARLVGISHGRAVYRERATMEKLKRVGRRLSA